MVMKVIEFVDSKDSQAQIKANKWLAKLPEKDKVIQTLYSTCCDAEGRVVCSSILFVYFDNSHS